MRRNAPNLIDPSRATSAVVDRSLGAPSAADTADRLDQLERRIYELTRQLNHRLPVELPQERPAVQVIGGDVVLAQFARLIAVKESPAPTVTHGTAAGTGGSVGASIVRGGSDTAGQIRVTAGTSALTTGTLVTLTFNNTKADTNYLVIFSPTSSAARAVNLSVSTKATTGFPLLANTAPTLGAQIDIDYLVIEVPTW